MLLNMLSQSWSVEQGSYVLTIASTGKQGDLAAIAKSFQNTAALPAVLLLISKKTNTFDVH